MYDNSKDAIRILGERIKGYRINYPLTQKELAYKSGVSVRCIQNFERGEDIQLSNLIKLLKALDLETHLDLLIPDMTRRPSDYLLNEKKRMRVRKGKEKEQTAFKWGDEA